MVSSLDGGNLATVTTAEFGANLQSYQDRTFRPHEVMIYPAILRTLESSVQGAMLCELGCGDGRIVDILARAYGGRYRSLTAVDINKVQREAARQLLRSKRGSFSQGKLRANILRGDIRELHFADDEFDLVLCSMVLVHFPPSDLRRALAETSRITRPGGRGLFIVTSFDWCRLQYPLEEMPWPGEPYRRCYRYARGYDERSWNQYTYEARDYEALFMEAGWSACAPREDLTIPVDSQMADRYQEHVGLPLFWVFHVEKGGATWSDPTP